MKKKFLDFSSTDVTTLLAATSIQPAPVAPTAVPRLPVPAPETKPETFRTPDQQIVAQPRVRVTGPEAPAPVPQVSHIGAVAVTQVSPIGGAACLEVVQRDQEPGLVDPELLRPE